jgi:hypothetical protein
MKATRTETMTSGVAAMPSEPSSKTASNAPLSGSRSMAAIIAPMPMPMAATAGRPGRCPSATPAAAPRKMLGKIGPPRNVGSDTL